MTVNGWIQIALFAVVIIALTKPVGYYMTRVFAGERTFLSPVLRPVERVIYAICGVNEGDEQHWVTYAIAMAFFSAAGFVALYAIQRLQGVLPFNPQGQSAVEQSLAFNTAVSFITNTNWQNYGGESTMTYLVQMLGLTRAEFRVGRDRHRAGGRADSRLRAPLGADRRQFLGRSDPLHALHPAAGLRLPSALFLVWQGMPQNARRLYRRARRWKAPSRPSRVGPVASQIVIKMLGTNGGGFFNANVRPSVREPDRADRIFVQMISIFALGARADQRLRPHGRQSAPGLGDLRRHGRALPRRRADRLLRGRGARQRRASLNALGLSRRQYGGQGSPFRHRRFRPVRRHHHGRLVRRGQRHAR